MMNQAIDAFHSITVSPEFREIECLYAKARHDEAQALRHERIETTRAIAKNLLLKGVSLEIIIEATGLSLKEVEWIMASIRSAFGLTTKDLAAVLRVERQTIYAWIRGENDPSLDNSRRLRAIFSYAEEWNRLSKLPAKTALRVPLGKNNVPLLDLLTQDHLDGTAIRRHMSNTADFVNERQNYRPSIRQLLLQDGLDCQRKIQQSQNRFACTRANPTLMHLPIARFNSKPLAIRLKHPTRPFHTHAIIRKRERFASAFAATFGTLATQVFAIHADMKPRLHGLFVFDS